MEEPRSDFQSLCTMIGVVVVNWSLAEQMLDTCVVTIYHDFAGNKLVLALPRSFSQKTKYVRTAFQKIPELSAFGAEGIALVDRFESLSERRHALVHAVVSGVQAETGKFEMVRLDDDRYANQVKKILFDPEELPALSKDLLDLGSDFAKFVRRLDEAATMLKK